MKKSMFAQTRDCFAKPCTFPPVAVAQVAATQHNAFCNNEFFRFSAKLPKQTVFEFSPCIMEQVKQAASYAMTRLAVVLWSSMDMSTVESFEEGTGPPQGPTVPH